jgi:hypothetical protein
LQRKRRESMIRNTRFVVSITNKYGIEKSKKRNGLAHSNVPKNEVIEDKKAKERERVIREKKYFD